jgi:hypothetical protein
MIKWTIRILDYLHNNWWPWMVIGGVFAIELLPANASWQNIARLMGVLFLLPFLNYLILQTLKDWVKQ